MKKKSLNTKMKLNKVTVANLEKGNIQNIKGGVYQTEWCTDYGNCTPLGKITKKATQQFGLPTK